MSAEQGRIIRDIKQRELEFLLSSTRVTFKMEISDLEAGEVKLKHVLPGETIELPRWAAEELEKKGIVEIVEEPFETEVYKALSREKILGALQLSRLSSDFYMKMRRRLLYLKEKFEKNEIKRDEFERFKVSCYDLVSMRVGKILNLANSNINPSELLDKITSEELDMLTILQEIARSWKQTMLGEKTW